MTRSIAKPVGIAQRSHFIALSFLFIFGASSACFSQRVEDMSQQKQPDIGEIQTQSVSGNLHCEIVTRTVSKNLELTGVVWASAPAVGNYSFVVIKQGSGGSSNIAQGGLFQVAPAEKRIVGTVLVNTLQGDRYHARLSARSAEDEVVCDTRLE